jgi:hypothetical protein
MPTRAILGLLITVAICGSAMADDKYTLHENLHAGQKLRLGITTSYKSKSTSTLNGNQTVTESVSGQSWQVIVTVRAVKDGSDIRAQAYFDPESTDTSGIAGQEKKGACPFAGKTITLARQPDQSITNDFQGDINAYDLDTLNYIICPDADVYPDTPVSVGDTWDNSAKMARRAPLGPGDQFLSKCRLDWVKTIEGKKMARVSISSALVYHLKGNVEEDMVCSSTNLIDIAAGTIVQCDETGSGQYKTPAAQAWQVTGGNEFTFHRESIPHAAATQTDKPKSAG